MGKIVGVLFLVVVLGVGLFIARSGVVGRGVTLFGGLIRGSSSTSESTATSRFPNFFYTSRSVQQPAYRPVISPPPPPAASPTGATLEQKVSPYEIPQGFTENDLSPYFHKVRIGGASPGSDFYYGQITLYANLSGPDGVNVSGWLLQARDGSQFIPRAVNIYDPVGQPVESDIYLKVSDQVYIYSPQSAVGLNLRLNKCIGYLENNNHFTPSLPLNCPYLDRSEVSGFSGKCQDYILSLGGCRLPDSNPLVPENDYACRSFLDTINQRGCFERHRNDQDFLSHEIRVWSGSRFLDERHDRLLLLDKQGLLVDIYSY